MNKLSVVINTLNEEKNITRAIKSVKLFADEIIVVDMESEDDTRKLAKKLGAKVFKHRRMGYVEPARNFAISKAKNDWILILDADEQIPDRLGRKISKTINTTENSYFAVPRKNIIFGKWISHSGWWPDYNIRLFKKGAVEWPEEIHAVPITKGQGGDFKPREKNAIVHYNYASIDQYINRLNRYTSIQAKERFINNKKFDWANIVKRPTSEFVSRFFMHSGYKDGIHGLALSLLQSFSELVVELKIWQEAKFAESNVDEKEMIQELKNSQKEINYWSADTLFKESGGFINKLKKKFKIL